MPLLIKRTNESGQPFKIYDTSQSKKLLVVGLGNPGPRYHHNFHNLGFSCLDEIARLNQAPNWQEKAKLQAQLTGYQQDGCQVRLIKPQAFVNNSGISVSLSLSFWQMTAQDLVVIYDDVDLKWGTIGVLNDHRHISHRGVRSIQDHLQTAGFIGLRVGIGPQPEKLDLADFVLQDLKPAQKQKLTPIYQAVNDLVLEASQGPISNGQRHIFFGQ